MLNTIRTSIGARGRGNLNPTLQSCFTRNFALDAVKGVLVIVMVAYHAMNIFSSAGPDEYAYIRFVSGSFVMVSGYIVAIFYHARFNADWTSATRKLVVRGVKLLILFTFLNLVINIFGIGNPHKLALGVQHYLNNFFKVYVAGEPRIASFQILLPIAYLLMAAPAVLICGPLVIKSIFVGSFVLGSGVFFKAVASVNLDFMLLGMIGLSGGILTTLHKVHVTIGSRGIAVTGLLVTVVLMKYLSVNLAFYAVGTIVILWLLYQLSNTIESRAWLAWVLVLLGQYSLICYIGQIAFLQLLYRVLARPAWDLGYEVSLVVMATVVFMLVLAASLEMLRNRYYFVGKAYGYILP